MQHYEQYIDLPIKPQQIILDHLIPDDSKKDCVIALADNNHLIAVVDHTKEFDQDFLKQVSFLISIAKSDHWERPSKVYFALGQVIGDIRKRITDGKEYDGKELLKAFDGILQDAIAHKSSDIHIKVTESSAKLFYRVNGELRLQRKMDTLQTHAIIASTYGGKGDEKSKDFQFYPNKLQQTAINRVINQDIKRLRFSSMDIVAADSSFSNTLMSPYEVVMRILPDGNEVRTFEEIGYSDEQIARLKHATLASHGLILTSGAMNSAKSTLQTALIIAIKRNHSTQYKKVLEIGSPIEFIIDMDGVTQRSIHTTTGMSEAERNRAFDETAENALRSDSQVFCLNEIRNKQTAKFALSTTDSGHLFLSTVHAHSALGIVKRLVGFGLEREVICSPETIKLLVHQSLIPKVCKACAYDYQHAVTKEPELVERLNVVFNLYQFDDALKASVRFRNNAGCQHCDKGLIGLTVVAEMVEPNGELLNLLSKHKEIEAYKVWRAMSKNGKRGERTCKEDGILKMLKGEVSPCSLEQKLGALDDLPLIEVLDKALVTSLFDDVLPRADDAMDEDLSKAEEEKVAAEDAETANLEDETYSGIYIHASQFGSILQHEINKSLEPSSEIDDSNDEAGDQEEKDNV
ncbi:GspE/PulE family protein [Cysteiniphilum marinum]|uniref:GspE/PulE family protein n=1 Tax=Cysteiniphilum marinum TaxID=2774191 RepID=UPI001939CFD7|nr:ATPase, T2SS/T4P/T4SS family [Cysteiniphilum marinum]